MIPEGIVTTGWPRVRKRGVELGLTFDPWQDGAHTVTLGRRADGKYAATVGGVTWSIPRQVGKTYAVGALMVLMCVMFPGYKVVWTAHHTRTSTSAFRSIRGMCQRKKILPLIALDARGKPAFRQSNGEQEITFRNGSVIMFGARSQGFGRGFDVVDAEVFDEAQILDEKALDDMAPATNQSRHPHGALIFYLGTPPRPADPSEAFTQKRSKALGVIKPDDIIRATRGDGVYLEMSADPDAADLDDKAQWLKANPSYPTRTPEESMLRLWENLPSDDGKRREGLGIWDEIGKTHVFGPGAWEACGNPARKIRPRSLTAIGIGVAVERDASSIGACVAGKRKAVLGVIARREGTGWVVPEAKRIQNRTGCAVVIAGTGPSSDLIPALEAAGVVLTIAKGNDVADAWSGLFDAVRDARVEHPDHAELNKAVKGAKTRMRSDAKVLDRRNSATDVSMLEGVMLAHWKAASPAATSSGFVLTIGDSK